MSDFDKAGVLPAIQKRLKSKISDERAFSGKTLQKITDEANLYDEEIIRPLDRPFPREGGIAVLFGNLTPMGTW